MNVLLFFLGLLASLVGGTITVNGLRGVLRLKAAFGEHTALGGVLIQIISALVIAISQI